MDDDPVSARRSTAIGFAALVIAAVLVGRFVVQHEYSLYDDAFIYLRYLKNLRHGCGLRFNCDDAPVEGFTSPAYLFVLWVASFVSQRSVALTQWIGGVSVALGIASSALVADRLLARQRPWLRFTGAALVVLALGLDDAFLVNSVIGLETALAIAVMPIAALATLARARTALVVGLAAFAWLVRPEAGLVLIAAPLFVPRRRRIVCVVAVVVVFAAVTAARFAVFHDWVPNTYRAKAGGTWAHFRLGLEYVAGAVSLFPLALLAPCALVERGRRRVVAVWLGVALVWLASFLRTGGDHYAYARLVVPLVPTLTAFGIAGALVAVSRALDRTPEPRRLVGCGVVAVACLGAIGALSLRHRTAPAHGLDDVLVWTALGRHLKARYPQARVATVTIGAIAYYSEAHVIDLVGLTSRAVADGGRLPDGMQKRNWIGHECHDTEWALAQEPDVFVLARPLRATPWTDADREQLVADYYAEWLFLRAVKSERIRMRVVDAALAGNLHVPLLVRAR